jgi:hypothetical protein
MKKEICIMMATVIGRGHGGTRAMSHTLSASDVYMGEPLNVAGDLLPPEDMYQACRVMGDYVDYLGDLQWDFSKVIEMDPVPEFVDLIERYLQTVMSNDSEHRGWKIPETTLIFPWITKMYPDIKYIQWVRDPRDSILKSHRTDDLSDFHIEYGEFRNVRHQRAISWKYQMELIRATPKPKNWITVQLKDFVLNQEDTLTRLEEYLGIPLARIEVRTYSLGRYKTDEDEHDFDLFQDELKEYGYK